MKVLAYDGDCLLINEYANPHENEYWLVYPCDLEPWDNKLHCLYCGAEIVIQRSKNGYFNNYNTVHDKKCILGGTARMFSTEQGALDAYSMKWEG
jgi:hypothetical protein